MEWGRRVCQVSVWAWEVGLNLRLNQCWKTSAAMRRMKVESEIAWRAVSQGKRRARKLAGRLMASQVNPKATMAIHILTQAIWPSVSPAFCQRKRVTA